VTLDEVATLKRMRRDPNCFLPGGAVGVVRPRTVSGELITDPEATKHNTIKLEALGDKLEDDIANLANQRTSFYVLPFEQYRDDVLREIDQKLKALLRLSKVMKRPSAVGADILDWKSRQKGPYHQNLTGDGSTRPQTPSPQYALQFSTSHAMMAINARIPESFALHHR
jgi:hypothetical protein